LPAALTGTGVGTDAARSSSPPKQCKECDASKPLGALAGF
jgi:hypothetical protein